MRLTTSTMMPSQMRNFAASTATPKISRTTPTIRMINQVGGSGDLAPQPGVADVAALVDDVRAQGIDATLVVDDALRALPAGLDLAVYRIVQEALTNVRRHAAAARVGVRLTYGEDEITVEVLDDGSGVTAGSPLAHTGGGHGLIGMRERAALYGGTLEAGAQTDGGFAVRAVLPVVWS